MARLRSSNRLTIVSSSSAWVQVALRHDVASRTEDETQRHVFDDVRLLPGAGLFTKRSEMTRCDRFK
jgi:hypothetical protein